MPRAYLAIAQTTGPATILVVEDEMLIRMSTTATLEDAGFLVLEASNSAEASIAARKAGDARCWMAAHKSRTAQAGSAKGRPQA